MRQHTTSVIRYTRRTDARIPMRAIVEYMIECPVDAFLRVPQHRVTDFRRKPRPHLRLTKRKFIWSERRRREIRYRYVCFCDCLVLGFAVRLKVTVIVLVYYSTLFVFITAIHDEDKRKNTAKAKTMLVAAVESSTLIKFV